MKFSKFLKSLYRTFFDIKEVKEAGNTTFKDLFLDYHDHPEKHSDKPIEQANEERSEYIEKMEKSISDNMDDFIRHMIWIGGGAQVLVAQLLLSDYFYRFSYLWVFRVAFLCLSLSLVIALISFISNIITSSLILSADETAKQIPVVFNKAKEGMSKEQLSDITNKIEDHYNDFVDYAKAGGLTLVARNGLLMLAALLFFVGIVAFVSFAGLNIGNLYAISSGA